MLFLCYQPLFWNTKHSPICSGYFSETGKIEYFVNVILMYYFYKITKFTQSYGIRNCTPLQEIKIHIKVKVIMTFYFMLFDLACLLCFLMAVFCFRLYPLQFFTFE